MTDLILIRRGEALVAEDAEALPAMRHWPEGSVIDVTARRPRSGPQHRWFWKLAARIAETLREMGDETATKDAVVAKLKIATGHVDVVTVSPATAAKMGLPTPLIAMPRASIAWHAMDHHEFTEFVRRCKAFIVMELLPHMRAVEISREIDRMLEESDAEPERGKDAA